MQHVRSIPDYFRQPRQLIRSGIISICLGILYFKTSKDLVFEWLGNHELSYGFSIPMISAYFLWERRKDLIGISPAPRNIGLVFVVVGLVLFTLGSLAAETFTTRFSLLIVMSGLVLFHLGWDLFKKLVFPIAFLIFMIPIPSILRQQITLPMQLLASSMAALSLEALGIPVMLEGNIIDLGHTRLEVAEACSGIRSLMPILALGTMFAYFAKHKRWQRAILFLAGFPIAVFVNSMRVTATCVLANYYGASVAEGFFHGFSGYVFFLAAVASLLILSLLLSLIDRSLDAPRNKI
jgi:exosortase